MLLFVSDPYPTQSHSLTSHYSLLLYRCQDQSVVSRGICRDEAHYPPPSRACRKIGNDPPLKYSSTVCIPYHPETSGPLWRGSCPPVSTCWDLTDPVCILKSTKRFTGRSADTAKHNEYSKCYRLPLFLTTPCRLTSTGTTAS